MSGQSIQTQLSNSTFSQTINIICSDICPDSLRRWTQPGKKINIWTYLLVVFKLDIKPTGFDHPSVCSWLIQCAEGKSKSPLKTDVECAVQWHWNVSATLSCWSLCLCFLSLSLTSSLKACYRFFHSLVFVMCGVCVYAVCVCGVPVLEGWQKSSSDGLQLCSVVMADASRGECFPSEWANSQDWSPSLPDLSLSPSFNFPIHPTCTVSLPLLLLFLAPCSLNVSPKCFLFLSFMHRSALSVWPRLTPFCIYFDLGYLCPL